MTTRLSRYVTLLVSPALPLASLLVATCIIYYFFSRTVLADDAYIVARYAWNWIYQGVPVYNVHEAANAVTTPLLLLVFVALTYFFPLSDPVLLYSHLSIGTFVLMLCEAIIIFHRHGIRTVGIFIVFVCTSPIYLFWLVGGLETPLVALLVFTIYVLFLSRPFPSFARNVVMAALSGILVLGRYDAILLVFPILLVLIHRCSSFFRSICLAIVSLLPLCLWLALSYYYYRSFLPTSFYVKAAASSTWQFAVNFLLGSVYLSEFLLYTSALLLYLALGIFAAAYHLRAAPCRKLVNHSKQRPYSIAYLGLLLFALYACFFSLVHMMYCFRLLVPFVPLLGLMISLHADDLWCSTAQQCSDRRQHGWWQDLFQAVLVTLLIMTIWSNLVNFLIITRFSLNPARVGEFRGRWDIGAWAASLNGAARAIEEHWSSHGAEGRCPIIFSPNEGLLAYRLPWARFCGGSLTCGGNCQSTPDYFVVEENIHSYPSVLARPGLSLIWKSGFYPRVNERVNVSRVLVYWNSNQ